MKHRNALLAIVVGSCLVRVGAAEPVTDREVGAALSRTALIDLGMRESPRAEDYEIAAAALWAASEMRPDDAETARLVAAAAFSSGDHDLLMDATRRIIRNDPADTVAQLRLVSAGINAHQTIEARLRAYERFLGPAGRSLDASVRSRLALDAALLLREQGDAAGFEQRLRQAVDLDPTNKDAVSLGARTFLTATTAVEEVAAWQIRLLYADPLDPHVHLTIARICAAQGAIDSADRFLNNAARLFQVAHGEVPEDLRPQGYALQWQLRGAEGVVERLNGPLQDMRVQAAMTIRARQEAGEPTADLKAPEEIRYDPGVETIRLLAAHSLGDEETVRASLHDLAQTTAVLFRGLVELAGQHPNEQARILDEMLRVFSEFQIMRAIVGMEHDAINRQIDEFFGRIPGATQRLGHLQAWVAYAEKDDALALDLIGDPRPGTADELLVALASQRSGDTERAVAILSGMARSRSLDAMGAFARERLRAMNAEGRIVSEAGRKLQAALGRVPAWMDRMTEDPRSFMLLQAETPQQTVAATEIMPIRVRLRNSAAIPLGLGSSRPIGSRVLIAPRPITGTADFVGAPSPRVLELDRRLRLEPLAEVEAVVEADSPYTQWLREINTHVSMRDRYRVIQSFQPSVRGGLINAPLALVTESPLVQRVTLALARAETDALIDAVRSEGPDQLRDALLATLTRTIEPGDGWALTPGDRRGLAEAWTERFARAGDDDRALMLLKLPHAGQVPEFEAFDAMAVEALVAGSLAEARADTGVLLATLMTRVRDPDSPAFELAAQSEDPRVRRLGRRLAERLRDRRPSFALAGPGAAGLAPPADAPGPGSP